MNFNGISLSKTEESKALKDKKCGKIVGNVSLKSDHISLTSLNKTFTNISSLLFNKEDKRV